ncbi:SDR family NAD(P)-dependent oxidoreductase [Amycolatopsis sp. WGS_07]
MHRRPSRREGAHHTGHRAEPPGLRHHVGVPDVVVTNAGYSDIVSIEDVDLASLRAVVETNLWGGVHVVKAALPVLREAGRGHFVQISSVTGRVAPAPGLGPYVTAKFAAEGFLEALAKEIAGFGIRVTIVEPGRMATSIVSSMAIPEPSAPYAGLIAPLADTYASGASAETDPAAAARFVLEVIGLDEPPLHPPLGGSAFQHILAAEQNRLAELAEWESFSRAAERPPGHPCAASSRCLLAAQSRSEFSAGSSAAPVGVSKYSTRGETCA